MRGNSFKLNKKAVRELKVLYHPVEKKIGARLKKFKGIWKKGSEEDIFAELVFCILTPQSKARSCDDAVGCLLKKDLMLEGRKSQIARELRGKVRFHNNKAQHIIEARKTFTKKGRISIKPLIKGFKDTKEAREWLVENIKGIGYKEAGHFLRNIGCGENLAILDRHILKNLKSLGVINETPTSLSKQKYLGIEKKMEEFAGIIMIPMAHLDLLLWYKETGEIFK
ncbi:MAG: N-glycosylase/DNA lyase [Thermoplasmata archaeon]|nr:MAG: N-glycosylase/DNA lyase [Thermoplasmata archaeon]